MPIIASRASAAYGAGFAAITAAPYEGPFGAYDSLAAITVPSGGLSAINFDGLPTGYKHLEIRMTAKFSNLGYGYVRFNNDASASYSGHNYNGAGSNPVGVFGQVNQTTGFFTSGAGTKDGGTVNVGVFSILDYANTSKNKTLRGTYGWKKTDGSGYIEVNSSAWYNLTAITNISLYPASGTFSEGSHIALYGVK